MPNSSSISATSVTVAIESHSPTADDEERVAPVEPADHGDLPERGVLVRVAEHQEERVRPLQVAAPLGLGPAPPVEVELVGLVDQLQGAGVRGRLRAVDHDLRPGLPE